MLVGFKRVTLDAGEGADVVIRVTSDALKVFDDEGNKVTPQGRIVIYAGFGQPDRRTEELSKIKAVELTI